MSHPIDPYRLTEGVIAQIESTDYQRTLRLRFLADDCRFTIDVDIEHVQRVIEGFSIGFANELVGHTFHVQVWSSYQDWEIHACFTMKHALRPSLTETFNAKLVEIAPRPELERVP